MEEKARHTVTDPEVMRALAHPARIAIMEHLTNGGEPLTATDAAKLVGLSPSATSYHLRALAKVGMVEDAPGRGDGRERVWRSPHGGWTFNARQDAPPEEAAAERALVEVFLAREHARMETWMSRSRDEPPEWYQAVFLTETQLVVTPDELRGLHQSIDEMLSPYKRSNRTDPPAGTRRVVFQTQGIPVEYADSGAPGGAGASSGGDQV
jgi:DNA-binding transcriptional ArsR family regulator